MDQLDRLLTVGELAGYLNVPVATLYAWRHRRQGPPGFKAGRHLRYRLSDVERWITDRLQDTDIEHPPTADAADSA
jgi:excisionase family DNA binding protein